MEISAVAKLCVISKKEAQEKQSRNYPIMAYFGVFNTKKVQSVSGENTIHLMI